jgi:cellulose synthase/poly-beta-1,6-N-acetylglucosamine synthase-like glycosyltransferase
VRAGFSVVLWLMDALVVAYVTVFFAIDMYFVLISCLEVRRKLRRETFRPPTRDAENPFLPLLTLLVPAYNEEVTCVESVRSLLRLDYPHYEIVICNDGSKDRTVEVLRKAFGFERTDINYHRGLGTAPIRGLYQATCPLPPNVTRLLLVDKANGGKADALNAAINASEGVFDQYCGAGAHTVCEDMEIVVRMHRYLLDRKRSGRILIDPRPVAWTEAPEVYRDLGKQRGRWYRGLLEVLSYHRGMLFRRHYGRIGLFSLPYQLLFEAAAPVIEVLGYILVPLSVVFGFFSAGHALSFLMLATALNVALSAAGLVISVDSTGKAGAERVSLFNYPRARDTLALFACALLSNFGYRQYLLYWQLRGLKDFLKGRKDWDKFARKEFGPAVKA